jgi:hypothetical protein
MRYEEGTATSKRLGNTAIQYVTVLSTVGNCDIMVSIIIYYNIMGSNLYMQSIVDRNIVMQCIHVVHKNSVLTVQ